MATYSFSLYTLTQAWAIATSGTATIGGTPATVSVTDDDGVLQDEVNATTPGGTSTSDNSQQVLTTGFGGANAGQQIQSVAFWNITNTTTGQTGQAYLINVYIPGTVPPTTPQAQYIATSIDMDPGDSITYSIASAGGDVPYSSLIVTSSAVTSDYIVSGTSGDDVIDASYTGDPDGDRVDANDNAIGNNDDVIHAGGGDDTVYAGAGDDEVRGGTGDDHIYGDAGNDYLFGESGGDHLYGGQGNDHLYGEAGADTLIGGEGADTMYGGDDADTFSGITIGDVVDGGESGNDDDTLDLRGSVPPNGTLHISYDANPENGTVEYFDVTGASMGTMSFTNIETVIPCFTLGVLIATPQGERLVEDLQVGDQVITRDHGAQVIRWIGQKQLDFFALSSLPNLQPILIKAGALGDGAPNADLVVSPNHRVLMTDWGAQLFFGEDEVLIAAKYLVELPDVDILHETNVTYIHFMFDQHEVVLSNGSWTESFQPGDYTLSGMDEEQRAELFKLFPELLTQVGRTAHAVARRSLKRFEARVLLQQSLCSAFKNAGSSSQDSMENVAKEYLEAKW